MGFLNKNFRLFVLFSTIIFPAPSFAQTAPTQGAVVDQILLSSLYGGRYKSCSNNSNGSGVILSAPGLASFQYGMSIYTAQGQIVIYRCGTNLNGQVNGINLVNSPTIAKTTINLGFGFNPI